MGEGRSCWIGRCSDGCGSRHWAGHTRATWVAGGSAAAATLLAAAADRAASAAERKLIALLRAAGIRGWVQHYRLAGWELDFAFPKSRVAVEVDGWAWHQDAQAFRRDRQRQNLIVLAGWTVLRFSWHDLTQRPSAVIGEIRSAHDRRN